jgi:hypothetical protein
MYYGWKKKLMSSASQIFDEKGKKRDVERERSERELARMKILWKIRAAELSSKFYPSQGAVRAARGRDGGLLLRGRPGRILAAPVSAFVGRGEFDCRRND